jgi:hypothetical protein
MLVVAALALVVAIGVPSAPAAAAPSLPDVRPMASDYYWEWSDDSDALKRTFAQSEYGTQGRLPKLIVTSVPALPSHRVKLQFFQDGAWRTEQARMTDSEGIATLTLNPFCSSGQWCDSTYKYRLTVARKVVRLVITYVRD